jgi:DNA repair exonuclease SbcCD ATPase subunit
MIVRRLLHECFAEAKWGNVRTIVDVPETGLVVVTGDNGSGKSTLIEVVCHALWGKSLRGKTAWRDVKGGSRAGVVLSDGTKITRKREGRRSHVEIVRPGPGDDGDVYDTATKAQSAIDAEWETFDVWRRSCVFSSSDAAHFSGATDGERKRLLEMVLGLERFDPALDACREELKSERTRVEVCTRTLASAEKMVEVEQDRLEEAQRDLEALEAPTAEPYPDEPARTVTEVDIPPEPDLEAGKARFKKLETIAARLEDIEHEIGVLREVAHAADRERAANDARVEQARKNFGKLGDATRCPTCRQEVSGSHRGRLEHGMTAFVADIEKKNSKLVAKRDAAREEIADLEREMKSLRSDQTGTQREIEAGRAAARAHAQAKERAANTAERDEREHTRRMAEHKRRCDAIAERNRAAKERFATQKIMLESRVRESNSRLADLEDESDEAAMNLDEARIAVAELEACEVALGLKGIRAQVLGRALDGIQAVANLWLERICGAGLSLTLKPYAEKKSGGVTDSISLVIEGAGGGEYLGASGGQRRRLDVALLLALAEVTRAAAGNEPGTCFFDEVFDALDPDGRAAVADALRELAKDRAVLVITHDEELARSLRAATYLEAKGGKVKRVA